MEKKDSHGRVLNDHGFPVQEATTMTRMASPPINKQPYGTDQYEPAGGLVDMNPQQLVASQGNMVDPADWKDGHPLTENAWEAYHTALQKRWG